MLALATKVLNDYSRVLSNIEPSNLGFSEAFLPHSKPKIREATRTALQHLGAGQPQIREALIRAFVYLEQFVPDAQAEVLLQAVLEGESIVPGTNTAAGQIADQIRQDMDRALREITAIGATLGPR
jgi:hypothetical protein